MLWVGSIVMAVARVLGIMSWFILIWRSIDVEGSA